MSLLYQRIVLSLAIGCALGSTAFLNPAQAQIATESFNYAAGTAVIATEGTGGTGWAFAWNSKSDTAQTQVSATGLSYTDGLGNTLASSGGSLISSTTTSTTAQPERALSSTIGALATANGGSLWMSYLWQGLNTQATSGGLYRQSIMMFITGATATSGSGSERLDIGMPNISAANQATVNPRMSLWTSGGLSAGNLYTSVAPLQSSVAANGGNTVFVLVQFQADTLTTTADTVNVWFNPNLTGAAPTGAADLTYASQDLSSINAIRLQSGNLNATYGSVGGAQQADEIIFGNTPASVEPVPEPATLSLAALGVLGLLALRRK